MKCLLIISLLFTSVICGYATQSQLQTFPRPAAAKDLPGLDKMACVSLESLAKVCQGLTDEVSSGAKFVVTQNGETVSQWQSDVFLGETTDYQVFRGDLDADGRDELIVANRTAVSNGLGVNYWTIAVLPFPADTKKLQPIQFQTEDFSVGAMFVPRRKSGGFDILMTDWQTLPIKTSRKQTALYLVGRWMFYQNGELAPLDRPILARRYLFSFERERLKNINNRNTAYSGLNSPSTEKRRIEPLAELSAESETDAIIENVIFDENSKNPAAPYKVSLKTSTGESLILKYSTNAGESENTFDFIANLARKRLYPKNYLPDLKGKSVRLTAYNISINEPILSRILWLKD